MAEAKVPEEIKEYADGWISERKGTGVPTFLKFAYIVIAAGCIGYLYIYMNGDVGNKDHGVFVQALNKATVAADALMTGIAVLVLVYVLIVVLFASRKGH